MREEHIEKHEIPLNDVDRLILAADAQLKEAGMVDEGWAMEEIGGLAE
jgi:hypothetical protein